MIIPRYPPYAKGYNEAESESSLQPLYHKADESSRERDYILSADEKVYRISNEFRIVFSGYLWRKVRFLRRF